MGVKLVKKKVVDLNGSSHIGGGSLTVYNKLHPSHNVEHGVALGVRSGGHDLVVCLNPHELVDLVEGLLASLKDNIVEL
ncbi:hypothetical protein UFOVP28_26 [uncultured Caudovirales phage]|uniref:Uncharacterized protein n=1 Tax=uncultured Caudovirales phage TaxID=2100421 RepID=A0A6J5KN56_9CAUD|nr:hypothetical protein UFOVP28_26 [uncultured Caudovirales phage]